MLFTVTCGLRISEALAVRFDDVDFGNKILIVSGQIGRDIMSTGLNDNEVVLQHIKPKSQNGFRTIPFLYVWGITVRNLQRQKYVSKPTLPFMDTSKYLLPFLTIVLPCEHSMEVKHTLNVRGYIN